jgi:hypothetical protein
MIVTAKKEFDPSWLLELLVSSSSQERSNSTLFSAMKTTLTLLESRIRVWWSGHQTTRRDRNRKFAVQGTGRLLADFRQFQFFCELSV